MDRLKVLSVAAAVAVAVSMVAAGPAAAAKGGNSDNAHACHQGGSGGLVAAETGLPFKNAGDCASHGAQGNDTSGLVLSLSMTPSYSCALGPDCYGTLTGSGLMPNSTVRIFFTFDQPGPPIESDVQADSNGNLSAQLGDTCPTGGTPLVSAYATGTLAQHNTPVQTPVVDDPCFNGKGR
jgi:hypothetical protein